MLVRLPTVMPIILFIQLLIQSLKSDIYNHSFAGKPLNVECIEKLRHPIFTLSENETAESFSNSKLVYHFQRFR